MKNTISIIVPNYNHALFLRERLESIFNQTYQDFEVILLDDCSTDNSVGILKEYSNHEKVSHLIINSKNSGSPFKQWKKGIELAKGDWIWIAESDDVANITFLERLIETNNTDVDLVYCRSNRINENGEIISADYFWPDGLDNKKWRSDFESNGNNEIIKSFLYRNIIPNASSCIFKKYIVTDIEMITNYKYVGDWLFWVNILKNSRMKYISNKLNNYRSHDSTSRSLKSSNEEIVRIKEYISVINFIRENFSIPHKIIYKNYDWIYAEIYKKRSIIKFVDLIKILPVSFLSYYLFFFAKERFNLF
jgi:glycosyltransferase involved in cell wall biosynthesis